MPEIFDFVERDSEVLYKFSLILGKKRINLWKDSRISDTGCGRMYEEYFVSLPGGFRLPIAICVDQYLDYETREAVIPEADVQIQLQEFSDNYLLRQLVAGQIVKKQQQLFFTDGLYKLESSYTCTEMIGKEQREKSWHKQNGNWMPLHRKHILLPGQLQIRDTESVCSSEKKG